MTEDVKHQPFIITTQSSYFLYPSDSPRAIISTIKFDRKNYDLWEHAVRTSLKSKNKLGFIDGLIIKLKGKGEHISDEKMAWEMVNSMIVSWIMNAIDSEVWSMLILPLSSRKILRSGMQYRTFSESID